MALSEESRNKSPRDSRQEAVVFLILFLIAVLPYLNTLFNDFVYDDGFQVVTNPYAHSFRYVRQIFTTTVWSFQGAQGVTNYYRPMMTFGYLLTYQIAGLLPFSFHLVNVVLEAIVVWLVFCILRRFSGERVALVAAGLFALHPIHTESVAWIAGVTDLELAVFYLAAFLLYLGTPEARNRTGRRAAMCACFALALISKEQAMTLPLLAMIFEHFYRDDRSETSPKEKFMRYAPLWIIALIYLTIRAAVIGGLVAVVMHPNLSWYETGLTALALIGGYLGKLVWPVRLSAFYVFHESRHFTDSKVLLGLADLVLCSILFSVLWRRARIVSFALLWIFVPLSPVLNTRWMPASVFGERYLYLPSIGFCWLVAWGGVQLWNGSAPATPRLMARAVPALLGAVALLYAVRTVSRNRDWRDDEILYRTIIETQGETSLIRSNLGVVAFLKGDLAGAEQDWLEALSTGPSNVFALDNMALLRRKQHRYLEANDYSWRALRVRPLYAVAHMNLAETLAAMGHSTEAESQFHAATALSPLSIVAHNQYGQFLIDQGRIEEARAEYVHSSEADPNTDAYDHLGDIYLAGQDTSRAEKAYRHALAGEPFDKHAHFGLGKVLEATGRNTEALHEYESGLVMDPTDAVAKAAAAHLRGAPSPPTDPR